MTDSEIIKRLLEENFELKDKLAVADDAYQYWYEKAQENEQKLKDAKVMGNV